MILVIKRENCKGGIQQLRGQNYATTTLSLRGQLLYPEHGQTQTFLTPSHSGIFMTMAIACLRKNIVEANQISNFMSISDLPLCSTHPTPPVILSTLLLNGPKVEVML